MTLALENITILDLSRMLPGPYCTMILSDLGANVIRVENPSDPMSNLPPFFQIPVIHSLEVRPISHNHHKKRDPESR